jgi:hypothetical protein
MSFAFALCSDPKEKLWVWKVDGNEAFMDIGEEVSPSQHVPLSSSDTSGYTTCDITYQFIPSRLKLGKI